QINFHPNESTTPNYPCSAQPHRSDRYTPPVRPVWPVCNSNPKIRSTWTYSRSIRTPKSGESGPIPGMFKSPPNSEYPDKWQDNPGPTGQTGTPDRSDRSYPDQT